MFRNREEAGKRLAAKLRGRTLRAPLILGIPRGGVVVAAAVARELGADLDVVLARKLRDPWQPELALGALSETGEVILNPDLADRTESLHDYLQTERRHQQEEIERRRKLFRAVLPAVSPRDRSVIVVDDGIATGSTMFAALKALRRAGAYEVIVAAPVAAPERVTELRAHCDDVICLLKPDYFVAIGQFYQDFTQVEDEEVVALLREFAGTKRPTALAANQG